jgi:type IX secretion system PorP/SprF family membrane protein
MRVHAAHLKVLLHTTFAQTFPNSMQKLFRLLHTPAVALAAAGFFLFLPKAQAQDKHFTQFYAAPLSLNPALTGAFEGRYRVGTIYRDQWRNVLENPIKTFSVAADFRFDASKRRATEDAFALGLMFFNDKVSGIDFNTTQIALSAAYHKSLDDNGRQFLTLGVQGGVSQRTVNYGSLSFHDQFDGTTGYTMGSQEVLPGNNISFSDFNVGLNYTSELARDGRFFAGVALHHFLQPVVSFYGNSAEGDRLHAKLSAQLAANIPLSRENRVAISPRLLMAMQGPHFEANVGTNFRFALGQYGSSALHFGTWARPVRNADGMGLDAVVALAGIEFNNVLLGLSYDLNIKALQASQRQGAFEISIAYLGSYENESVLCPKF